MSLRGSTLRRRVATSVELALFTFSTAIAGCGDEGIAPAPEPASFHVLSGWPRIPEGTVLGQVSGVGIDSAGDVLFLRRAERDWVGATLLTNPILVPTVMRFDAATGELRAAIGAGLLAMPHGLSVDKHNHLWVTDVALHQVFELDANGALLRTFGERGVSGDDSSHFFMPTDVAIADDGSFFVSDGYGNARIVKFGADGHFELAWGEHGSLPGQFSVPHAIALGPDGNLYVADRGNARVQIFDTQGGLQGIWQSEALGRPWSIAFDDRGHAFVVDGGDQKPPGRARVIEVGANGETVTSFGSYGTEDGQFIDPHDIAVGHDGAVYVVEVGLGRRGQKFVPTQ